MVIVCQLLVVALLLLLAFCHLTLPVAAEALVYPACLLLVALSIWSFWSWWAVTGRLLDPYVLFLAAAVLFNGGQALLEIFHLNSGGILKNLFPPETVLDTLFLVTSGLTFLHLGALVGAASDSRGPVAGKVRQRLRSTDIVWLRWTGWALLAVSLVPALLLLRGALSIVMKAGYSALYQQQASTSFGAAPQVLAAFLVPGALFLLAGSRGRRADTVVSALVILTYSGIQFFLGSRSQAVMPLIAYAWFWHRCIRPLPTTAIVAGAAILLFVVFPVVRVTRGLAGAQRLSLAFVLRSFLTIQNPVVSALSEMGGSMMTVAYTLQLVPALRGFDRGAGYLYALLTALPNLFWHVHPTIARGLAGNWLVWTVAPKLAALGGGYGYSFIAESYLNFGWLGAPLILAPIGFLYARLVSWAESSRDPAKMALVSSFLSFFLIYARGESGTVLRPLLWYCLLPYLLARLLPHLTPAALRGVGSMRGARDGS